MTNLEEIRVDNYNTEIPSNFRNESVVRLIFSANIGYEIYTLFEKFKKACPNLVEVVNCTSEEFSMPSWCEKYTTSREGSGTIINAGEVGHLHHQKLCKLSDDEDENIFVLPVVDDYQISASLFSSDIFNQEPTGMLPVVNFLKRAGKSATK